MTNGRVRALLAEAALLGIFMVSACGFAALLFSPASPLDASVGGPAARLAWMGLAMGATAVALFHTPMARVSGAHMNPAVTLAFLRLGRIRPADAALYPLAQAAGGLAGTLLAAAALGDAVAGPPVRYAATTPGAAGGAAAFAAEVAIGAAMFGAVLAASRSRRPGSAPFVAAALLAAFVALVSPLSGTSLNPARSLASAIPSGVWTSFWVYLTAPVLGMALAAEVAARRDAARGCCRVGDVGPDGCEIPGCTCRAADAPPLPT